MNRDERREFLLMSETTTTSSFEIEATAHNFQQEVIERSRTVPVIVDFWAPWCNPCRMLSPVLEKLAREYDGKFILAKVDTDREPVLAQEFGVRSIPVVFGIRDGKPVDAFMGIQPEAVIRTWLDRLIPSPAETMAAEAGRLERSDPRAAEEKYNRALSLDPELATAQTGLARIALEDGRLEDAGARILGLERRGFLEPEAEKVKAELTLRLQARPAGSVEAARAALAANPSDLGLKFQLAEALAAAGQYADALALCLELVERDRKGIGEKARQTMVAIFQLLPPDLELVAEYQRQLSLALSE
jgi:putative thioredoxin